MKVKSLSRVRLLATPWTVALHGIFQARVLEWGAIALVEIINACKVLNMVLLAHGDNPANARLEFVVKDLNKLYKEDTCFWEQSFIIRSFLK